MHFAVTSNVCALGVGPLWYLAARGRKWGASWGRTYL